MAAIHTRDYNYGWTSSGGARWAFFAIFIVLIIIVILGTLRVNRKRARHGGQPIYGTSWMTPPSYLQSENQQNRNNRGPDGVYVPTYTAEANDTTDMGYYDANGVFHASKKTPINGPTFTGLGSNGNEIPAPEATHNRQDLSSNGIELGAVPPHHDNVIFSDEIAPPPGAPPPPSDHPLYNEEDFSRPVGPPPKSSQH